MATHGNEVEFEPNNIQKEPWTNKVVGTLNSTKAAIWNSSKGEFIGRTWLSWAKIGLFYVIFYSALAAFFAIMLAGFFSTLDDNAPTQQHMYSLIKANPGMGFRPMPNIESTLIRFSQGERSTYVKHVDSINRYLEEYFKQEGNNLVDCKKLVGELPEGKVCDVRNYFSGSAECTSDTDYGYDEGRPCVLLKINKIYDWKPKQFERADYEDESNVHANESFKRIGNKTDSEEIGISCEGENDADIDNIGKVKFYPTGFPFTFYPYKKQKNYRPPILFAKFERPKNGALIQVWCKLWAKNIKHHKNDKAGSIHFELLVD